jgi:hypothetical protein
MVHEDNLMFKWWRLYSEYETEDRLVNMMKLYIVLLVKQGSTGLQVSAVAVGVTITAVYNFVNVLEIL